LIAREKIPLIIIKAAIIIILLRTNDEMTMCIRLSFANLQTLKSVQKEINVEGRITELRDYIIKINTKLNFVTVIQTK
jgi:hypothetical protein